MSFLSTTMFHDLFAHVLCVCLGNSKKTVFQCVLFSQLHKLNDRGSLDTIILNKPPILNQNITIKNTFLFNNFLKKPNRGRKLKKQNKNRKRARATQEQSNSYCLFLCFVQINLFTLIRNHKHTTVITALSLPAKTLRRSIYKFGN